MTSGAPAADAEGREGGSPDEPRGFSGRGGWHLVALLAALGLILALSVDWYTTEQGEEFRRVEDVAKDAPRQVDPNLDEDAAHAAEEQEKTAWQADAFIDRLILIACLVAFAAAVAGAVLRSAGRRPEPPRNPMAIATVAGLAGTVMVLYRMFQPPGINEAAVIKLGAPLGLVAVGFLTIGARLATLVEQDERAEARGERPARAEPEPEPEPRAARAERRRRRGRRRERPAEPPAPATPAASGAPGDDAVDFDFTPPPPAAAEPAASDRPAGSLWHPGPEEPADDPYGAPRAPEPAPPVDARPAGAPNPEEAPEWTPQEDPGPAAGDAPVDDAPVEGGAPASDAPIEEAPVEAPNEAAPSDPGAPPEDPGSPPPGPRGP